MTTGGWSQFCTTRQHHRFPLYSRAYGKVKTQHWRCQAAQTKGDILDSIKRWSSMRHRASHNVLKQCLEHLGNRQFVGKVIFWYWTISDAAEGFIRSTCGKYEFSASNISVQVYKFLGEEEPWSNQSSFFLLASYRLILYLDVYIHFSVTSRWCFIKWRLRPLNPFCSSIWVTSTHHCVSLFQGKLSNSYSLWDIWFLCRTVGF